MILDYIEQYRILHNQKKEYGMKSVRFYNEIILLVRKWKIKSILDYGCGKSKLIDKIADEIPVKTYKYDPAIENYSILPNETVDLVICTDVLQHIPLFDLDRVLNDIKTYTNKVFFHIRCTDYKTLLPNGEPANCTVYPAQWWKSKIKEYFKDIIEITTNDINTVTFITGIKNL